MIAPVKNYGANGGGGILSNNQSNISGINNDSQFNTGQSKRCEESYMVAPTKNYNAGGGGGILENNRPDPIYIDHNNFNINYTNQSNTNMNDLLFDSTEPTNIVTNDTSNNFQNNEKANNLMFDSAEPVQMENNNYNVGMSDAFQSCENVNNMLFDSNEDMNSIRINDMAQAFESMVPFYDKNQEKKCNFFDSTEMLDNNKNNDNPSSRFQAAKFRAQTPVNKKNEELQSKNFKRTNTE